MRNLILAAAAVATMASLGTVAPARAANDVSITAHNFAFAPAVVTLKKGTTYTFHLKAIQGAHGLNVPQIGLQNVILTSAEQTVKVTPEKAGTFEAHCAVYCGTGHPNMAMKFIVK